LISLALRLSQIHVMFSVPFGFLSRWSRCNVLPDGVRNLRGGLMLAHVMIFLLRNMGAGNSDSEVSCVAVARRALHSVCQQVEVHLTSHLRSALPPDANLTTELSRRTLKQNSVRSVVVARHFFRQPARSIMTQKAGGLPACIDAKGCAPYLGDVRTTCETHANAHYS
jgi:hypothetical protein